MQPLTPGEITTESIYRYEERLAILCPEGQPTAEQKAIARKEADEWEKEYRAMVASVPVVWSQGDVLSQ